MNTPNRKRVISVVVLAALALSLALVPQTLQLKPAAAQTGGVGASACLTPGVPTATLTPTATTAASISPVGTPTSTPVPFATFPVGVCVALPAGGTQVPPNPTISICGLVTAFTPASASLTGSITVNGITVTIPVGYVAPSYVTTGANIILVFTATGNNLVEISPGNCPTPVPLAADAPETSAQGMHVAGLGFRFAN